MATNSLHLTTFCLQYPPPVVACVCIHLACKWSNWEIPVSTDGKNWWEYVDPTVTLELLDGLTHEFLQILEKTPNRLKRIKNWRACQAAKKPRVEGQGPEEGHPAPGLATPSSSASAADSAFSELMSIVASSVSGGGVGPPQPGTSRPWPQLGGGGGEEEEEEEQQQSGEAGHGAAQRNGSKCPAAAAPAGPMRVSLSEYRAKHAEELASQKRKLESLEASVREDYASAAQALLEQQKVRDRKPRDAHHPLPIRIRLPVTDAGEEQLRVRIKVPAEGEGGEEGRSRHAGPRDKRKDQASNHHHHHHHRHRHHHHHHHHQQHQQQHHHGRHAPSGRREEARRRLPREEETAASALGHHRQQQQQRPGKPAKASAAAAAAPPSSSSSSSSTSTSSSSSARFNTSVLDLPFPPPGLPDKEANGHGGPPKPGKGPFTEHSHYQDTFDMLESLLSAQGMPPAPQPRFSFLPAAPLASRVPPPLPAESLCAVIIQLNGGNRLERG
ncbi:cyclin-T1-like [Carcharodon carcharias]|uniref:cyclin-T1-like n=1 Tax=Carcharodon carcharias TaxID=13397 RepID=UPI001B7E8050|nr:cyclin-T1-like [Carcharodon carcharias]